MASVKEFLSVSDGSGYGNGDGSGYGYGDGSGYGYGNGCDDGNGYGNGSGYGDGDGYGYGNGYGDGSGYGNGDGSGYGYGNGVLELNGDAVNDIDGVQTIVKSVKGNLAKGFILKPDLTLEPTFIAKVGDHFAHGKTSQDAFRDATAKSLEDAPAEERVHEFLKQYPADKSHSGVSLIAGYRLLTGACEQGCRSFAEGRGIDLDAFYSLAEFANIVRGAYPPGDEAIEILAGHFLEN